jgi:hypothetical protein
MKFSKIVFPDNSRIITEIKQIIIDREHSKIIEQMIKNGEGDDEYEIDEYEEEY